MYKASTQKNHRHIAQKHLLPRFGDQPLLAVTRQSVQAYVADLTQTRYAPKTIDHIHDVLSAVLRSAVDWGHLEENPARGVRLPKLRNVRPRWVLTTIQAGALLQELAPLPRAMVALALLSGLRRGELFALRWRDVDQRARVLHIREAVYEGTFGTPKTEAGLRQLPLSDAIDNRRVQCHERIGVTVRRSPVGAPFAPRRWSALVTLREAPLTAPSSPRPLAQYHRQNVAPLRSEGHPNPGLAAAA